MTERVIVRAPRGWRYEEMATEEISRAHGLVERLGTIAHDCGFEWAGGEFERLLLAEIQAALDAERAERDAEWNRALWPTNPEHGEEVLTPKEGAAWDDELTFRALEDAKQTARSDERRECARIARKPQGSYQVGCTAQPYWDGEKIARTIEARDAR
jgi:hypothetical protein